MSPYAHVKTTRGMTLIKSNTDFEKAYTNFTIRYPHTKIDRDMEIEFNGKVALKEILDLFDGDLGLAEIKQRAVAGRYGK